MSTNQKLFIRAQKTIAAGVNSPVRAFSAVGGTPYFVQRAQGPYVWDIEGTRYIDYVASWGPMITGHAHPQVLDAVARALAYGLSFGAPTEAEIQMAECIHQLMPAIEQIRLVSSGTEATMSALRLARGVTGRAVIVKFEGGYHGHVDSLLVQAGSGLSTFSSSVQMKSQEAPSSAGIPPGVVQDTRVLAYNDLQQLERLFTQEGEKIAAVIIEPVAGNMNLVRARAEFLQRLRALCNQYHALLIFDEVMSGFRVALGGAQQLYQIQPDLTCLGKIVGGGLPLAAFGGKKALMAHLAPQGTVYQAGTLSGNPIAVAAGLATLQLIQQSDFYTVLEQKSAYLTHGLKQAAERNEIAFSTDYLGGLWGFYFCAQVPTTFSEVCLSQRDLFTRFFHLMRERGVAFAPSAFEASFISSAHDDSVLEETLVIADQVFKEL